MSIRRLAGSTPQGTDEAIRYPFNYRKYASNYGAPTAAGACTLWDITSGTPVDVSAACLSGSASVDGNVVTSKIVENLTAGKRYQLNQAAEFTGGYTFSHYVIIDAEV